MTKCEKNWSQSVLQESEMNAGGSPLCPPPCFIEPGPRAMFWCCLHSGGSSFSVKSQWKHSHQHSQMSVS